MKIVGVIAEFNPFHNGHRYLIEQIKKDGSLVAAVMSGDFVQRGQSAVLDKHHRAEIAVKCGVDIVFELPQIYSCASAENFAFGGVSILDSCGCIDELAFGAECGDISEIQSAVALLDDVNTQNKISENIKKGMSYPNAVQMAVGADILLKPNNTLAVEYLKALKKINSTIKPICIKRIMTEHDSHIPNGNFASASAVREMIFCGDESYKKYVPDSSANIICDCIKKGEIAQNFKYNERGAVSIMRRMSADDWRNIPDVSEGLENRIMKSVRENITVDDVIMSIKCKRYTYARISRAVCCAYIGITKSDFGKPQYIRVLAFSKSGIEILRKMKNSAKLPVITKFKDSLNLSDSAKRMFDIDMMSSDMYKLLQRNERI